MKKICLLLLSVVVMHAAEIAWSVSYTEACEAAKNANKPLFVYMSKAGCDSCEYMNKVMSEDVVSAYIEKHYIPLQLTPVSKDVPPALRAKVTPTFHFITSEGVPVQESFVGGKQASGFLRILQKGVRAYKQLPQQ